MNAKTNAHAPALFPMYAQTLPSSPTPFVVVVAADAQKGEKNGPAAAVAITVAVLQVYARNAAPQTPATAPMDAGSGMASTTVHVASANDRCTIRPLLFVKFHKVGGTSMAHDIQKLHNAGCETPYLFNRSDAVKRVKQNQEIFYEFPLGGKHVIPTHCYLDGSKMRTENANYCNCHECSSHVCSISIAKTFRNFVTGQSHNITTQRSALYSSLKDDFHNGVNQHEWASGRGQCGPKSLLLVTILRNPLERIRSKYYFQRGNETHPGWCAKVKKIGDKCPASSLTFYEWLTTTRQHNVGKSPESCCEYAHVLGGGNVGLALRALRLFDFVAITERYEESVRIIAGMLGQHEHGKEDEMIRPVYSSHARDNSASKFVWSRKEKEAAEKLVAGDMQIYQAALKRWPRSTRLH